MFSRKKRKVEKIVEGVGESRKRRKNSGKLLTIALIVFIALLAIGVGFLGYNYINMQKEIKNLKDPKAAEALAKQEVQRVVEKVGAHMILPKGEEPTLASITDIDALKKEQPFYEGAENGDQILVYKNAKIGIVYSPTKDKIVKVGPVVFQEDTSGTTTSPTSSDSSSSSTSSRSSDGYDTSSSSDNTNLYNQFNNGQ